MIRIDHITRTRLKLGLLILIPVLYLLYRYHRSHYVTVAHFQLSLTDRVSTIYPKLVTGQLGVTLPEHTTPTKCDRQPEQGSCLKWSNYASLTIREIFQEKGVSCVKITWDALSGDFKPKDCYRFSNSDWYGGSLMYQQSWPICKQQTPLQQFISTDYYAESGKHTKIGPLVEPYWFNSHGTAFLVDDDVPLYISMNENGDKKLCLAADNRGSYIDKYKDDPLKLSYKVCQGSDAKHIHEVMSQTFLPRPKGLPDKRTLKSPIWSTWARYKSAVNQSNVLELADEIARHNFPHSQLEIDDMYTSKYGDFDFNITKFPDAKKMIGDLHDKGFRVTSWITPFANYDSNSFKEGLEKGYWVKDFKAKVPSLVKWWRGVGGALDTSNPNATKWFQNHLDHMRREYGIDGFKFDSGEISYLPEYVGTTNKLSNINEYTKKWVETVAAFGGMIEVRSGFKSQEHPIFFRMLDKDSTWDENNGLRSIIPTALVMSVIGYSYILPDMIGGNGYTHNGMDAVYSIPDRELYIRWVQMAAYFPSMQFSFCPWQFDEEVVKISQHMIQIHQDKVYPIILEAAEQTVASGSPILRPLWWADPLDAEALRCDSQFLVGADLLVSPVLEKGARARDVYLPRGTWRDELRGEQHVGPRWLSNYRVDLQEIATFTRVS